MKPPKPSKLALLGFLTASGLFSLYMIGPHVASRVSALVVMGAALVLGIASFLTGRNWNKTTLYHKFMLVAGMVAFLASLTPLQEFDKNRLDKPRGMLIVGIVTLVLLLILERKAS